ncbi:MAG TPA: hypothetical protein DCG75_18710 [Bacteroidales bacterium]|nr:hypothetical protein [Bacteroidales bacterium]
MHKIVFQNPDGQPKPAMENTYTSIISANISEIKCATHGKSVDFKLIFHSPNTYMIEITACCDEFKAIIDDRVAQMLS